MYKFSNCSKSIHHLNKVVLGNKETAQWIRISKETYDIFKLGIDENLSIEKLQTCMSDEEDKVYIQNVYERLLNIGVLEDEKNKFNYQNATIGFEITHRCNLKCIHCCIDADEIISNKKDLSTREIKKMFDKAIKWNPKSIMLSGGEPMLRKDFIELLIYLKKNYGGRIIVSTNGTFINNKNVDILKKCVDQIDISLDGVDEKTCSIIRGPGIFDRIVNNIKLLKNSGIEKISVSMAVADKNDCLENEFIKLNKKLGTKPVIRKFSQFGRGKENKDVFSNLKNNEFYIPETYLKDDYNELFGISNCKAGKRELIVAYNGDIYPCPSFMDKKYLIGNLLKVDSIETLLDINNRDLLDTKILDKYEKCKDCKVNLFCWTCPGTIEEIDNNEMFEDRCKKLKPVLYKRVWGE